MYTMELVRGEGRDCLCCAEKKKLHTSSGTAAANGRRHGSAQAISEQPKSWIKPPVRSVHAVQVRKVNTYAD
jgi:hypothetical protein